MIKSDMVVKSNKLNTAIQNLSLTEIRLIQLAIIDAREHNRGLSADKPLRIDAKRYAEAFEVSRQTAHEAILNAEKTLFNRQFSFLNEKDRLVKSRWVQRVEYLDNESAIEVIFTYDVIKEIAKVNGKVDFFTKYLLKQTSSMTSSYSVRLYELLVQWKAAKRTPEFDLQQFREQLGVDSDDYSRMSDFKKRVLDVGVKEINNKSDLIVGYEQKKKGSKISGFCFTVKVKPSAKPTEGLDAPKLGLNTSVDALRNEQKYYKLTPSQLTTYSNKLSRLHELGEFAGSKGYPEYAAQIAIELADPVKQVKYHKYLDKVGFKVA